MTFKTLDLGSAGSEVRRLQEILMKLGYRIREVTEEFDEITRRAVKAYQNDNGLPVTGVADLRTWEKLGNMMPDRSESKADAPEMPKVPQSVGAAPPVVPKADGAEREDEAIGEPWTWSEEENEADGDMSEGIVKKDPANQRKVSAKKIAVEIPDEGESAFLEELPPTEYIPALKCDDEGCVGFAMIKKPKKEKERLRHSGEIVHRIDPDMPWAHTSVIIPSAARGHLNAAAISRDEKKTKLPETKGEKKAETKAEAEEKVKAKGKKEVKAKPKVEEKAEEKTGAETSVRADARGISKNQPKEYSGRGKKAAPNKKKASEKKPIWSGELRPVQWGSRNRYVSLLQRRLAELGYFKGDNNGYFGFETRMAVIDFQLDREIKASGTVDEETWRALFEIMPKRKTRPKLKKGDKGEHVVTIQKYLKEMAYYDGEADGIFGSLTQEAAVKFQKDSDMAGDGVVDDATCTAMETKLMSMPASAIAE